MSLSVTRIKMCGMTNRDDIDVAIQLGVNAIGLIFYEKSARYVTLEKAKTLLVDLPPMVSVVAVLVNPDKAFVTTLLQQLPIDYLQFHGDESHEFCEQFNKPYIKACHAHDTAAITQCMLAHKQAVAILVDTPSPQYGGTGNAFDWQIIPKTRSKPLILSGGLDSENVADAIAAVHPFAIDVCSGVEAEKGKKDKQKMQTFMTAMGGHV